MRLASFRCRCDRREGGYQAPPDGVGDARRTLCAYGGMTLGGELVTPHDTLTNQYAENRRSQVADLISSNGVQRAHRTDRGVEAEQRR